MKYALWALAAVFAFKLVSNISKLIKTDYYLDRLQSMVHTNQAVSLLEDVEQVRVLAKSAGVEEDEVPALFQTDNIVGVAKYSSVRNLAPDIPFIYQTNLSILLACKGKFKSRIWECFSPLYWIKSIVFLPATLFNYCGFPPETSWAKLCNVILTGIWWVIGIFYTGIRSEIIDFLKTIVQNLQ